MPTGDPTVHLPVNLKRLIETAQVKFGIQPHKKGPTGLSPMAAISQLQELQRKLVVVVGDDGLSKARGGAGLLHYHVWFRRTGVFVL